MLEQAAQQKAGVAPPLCPQCQHQLSGVSEGHGTTIPTRFGPIRVQRARFACQPCRQWRFQADTLLGLPADGTQSPAVQEMAALAVSQPPAAPAEHLVERLAGIKISAATLGRQGHQPGKRAREKRGQPDQQMSRQKAAPNQRATSHFN